MSKRKYTDDILEAFIFDCMLENDIKYMPSAKQMAHFDYGKYGALCCNSGTEHWREYLMLQTKEEYEVMVRRKVGNQ